MYEPPHRIVLLAQSRTGWARLCRLTSAVHAHGDGPPVLAWDDLRAARLLADTATTADACAVDPVKDLGLGRPHFPEPAVVGAPGGIEHAARLLRERAETGLIRRGLDRDPHARQRLEEELAAIRTLKYDTYFLTVAQVVADVL
ncbi:hypothetical protein [Streptomyces chiangmaiensis]|uniref:hypothetical protein n=1 Tax=Streptomyces chiangmaiensis TaxID=766497 RepID=UPI00338995CE